MASSNEADSSTTAAGAAAASAGDATALPPTPSGARMASAGDAVPASRVDRLLRERIRKSRSAQALDHLEEWDKWDADLVPLARSEPSGGRLIVVANRLPVTCTKDAHGRWRLQISAGGLVSALMGVNNYSTLWIGWPGIYVKPNRDRDALTAMLVREGYLPVWLESGLLDAYYNGFCNSVLWQLFHYVPLQLDGWQRVAEHQTLHTQWEAYQKANALFGQVVLSAYKPGDMVWVQDYHLMLLPSILKQTVPRMKVGWFLHTPFPSSEIYRTLPVREEVLRATLKADLIGFHTYDYARHFISSCTRILGLEGTPEGVEDNGSVARVAAFPIGIDPERFGQALETEEVQMNIAKLLNRYAGRKVMLGVDRLDMIKGIPQKLLAFEKFLQEHEEWRDKVLLVQIAVPSRTDVPEYQKLRSMVHEIVGRINGAFGTLTYVPIHHLDRQLSFHELCALYAVTDVALITSLRDGMNLVSYEYVACQADNAGVLVLSEFAGAAQSLGAGAILVNPWNINDVAAAIEDALTMSEEERRERHRQNYMHVATHTAQTWADTFISELNDTHIEADLRLRHTPPELEVLEVVRGYGDSGRRLIVLGYNATLTTAVEAPRQPKRHFDQIKALTRVNPRIMNCLERLCADPSNEVLIFSGSEMAKLEETFGGLPLWLAAENGVYVRPPIRPELPQEWRCLFETLPKEWMESVQLVLDYFCERTPRSFVEVRDTSLVWNYKHADVEFGRLQARDLLQHLWTGPISNAPVEIIQGGRSVEVRPVGVTKGLAMQRILGYMASICGTEAVGFDFVLCIGHLLARDENMYLLFEGHKLEGQTRADLKAALAHGTSTASSMANTSAAAAAAALAAAAAASSSSHSSHQGGALHHGHSAFPHHHPILGAEYGTPQQQAGSNAPAAAAAAAAAAAGVTGSSGGDAEGAPGLQHFPLHAIREGDEAAAAAAGGRQAPLIGVSSHRLFAQAAPTSPVAAAAAPAGAGPIPAVGDAAATNQSAAQNSNSSSTSPDQPPELSAAVAAAAAGAAACDGQDSGPHTGPGVYAAAARNRRCMRQQPGHPPQQPLQQQQAAAVAAATAAMAAIPADLGARPPPPLQQQHLQQPPLPPAALHSPRPPLPPQHTQQQQQQQQPGPPPLPAALQQQLHQLQVQFEATKAAAAAGGDLRAPRSPGVNDRPSHKRTSSGSTGSGPTANGSSSSSTNALMRALKFPPKYLFTCSVGRSRSKARYSLNGSNDVGTLLEAMIDQVSGGLEPAAESAQGPSLHLNSCRDPSRDGNSSLGLSGGGAGGVLSGSTTSSSGGGAFVGPPSGFSRGHSGVLGGAAGTNQEAIMRAIEAASAARGSRRKSTDQGFVSQGSLQGFAREDMLISSPVAWQQQRQGLLQQGQPQQLQQQHLDQLQQQHLEQLQLQQQQQQEQEAVGLSWHAASSSPDTGSSPIAGSRHLHPHQQQQSLFQQALAQQSLPRSRHPHPTRHSE